MAATIPPIAPPERPLEVEASALLESLVAEGDDRAPAGVLEEGKPEEGLDTWAGGGGAGVGVAAGFDGVGGLVLELELLEDCELDA